MNLVKPMALIAAFYAVSTPLYAASQINGPGSLMAKDGVSSGILLACHNEKEGFSAVVERDEGMLNVQYTFKGSSALNFRGPDVNKGSDRVSLENSAIRAAVDYCNSGEIHAPQYYQ